MQRLASLFLVATVLVMIPSASAATTAQCGGLPATIVGDGIVTGTPGPDVIVGGDGDDVISGRGGSDVICGGAGNDRIDGGVGRDRIYGEGGADRLEGSADPDRIWGGQGNDRIFGNAGNDILRGGDGDDTVVGGHGDDEIDGGHGHDVLAGSGGDDTINGDSGNDTVNGGAGNDTIDGEAGNDHLAGKAGLDRIAGGRGDDRIFGGADADELKGSWGHDEVRGGLGNDTLWGGAAGDGLRGGAGDDVMYGGAGNDSMKGNTGDDTLYGDDHNDRVYGGKGDDQLDGGDGFDRLYGQDGIDTCLSAETARAGCEFPEPPVWHQARLPGMIEATAVGAGPAGYVVAGRDVDGVELWTSRNGFEWQPLRVASSEFPADYAVHEVDWTGSEYVALLSYTGFPGTATGPVAWRSTNLRTWDPMDLPCAGQPYADQVAASGVTTVIVGGCDRAGGTWVSSGGAYAWYAAPFTGLYELVAVGDRWYGLGAGGLWVSPDADSWAAMNPPFNPANISDIAGYGDTLYVVADGYGSSGAMWTTTGDGSWFPVAGLAAGENLYAGGSAVAGAAGILAAWQVGYPPSAHQTQSPVLIERGDVLVYLFQPEMPDAAFITDRAGNRLLTVSFPDPGSGPPEHTVVDTAQELVLFFDPSSGEVLAELAFDEIEAALQLDWPRLYAWWSADGVPWSELSDLPVADLRRSAVWAAGLVTVQGVGRAEYPFWVNRLLGLETDFVSETWVLETPAQ
jgi:hypothetical protein